MGASACQSASSPASCVAFEVDAALFLKTACVSHSLLAGSWYLLINYHCTYNHIRALKGLISGLKVRS